MYTRVAAARVGFAAARVGLAATKFVPGAAEFGPAKTWTERFAKHTASIAA